MNSETVSVFIVDDHQVVLDGLEKIILESSDLQLVGMANDGKEAVRKIPILLPDVVLIDLDMPLLNGLDASRRLLEMVPSLKIVILTMHSERAIVERMMKIGVHGYLVKNTDKEELVLCIRQVAKGKKYFQADALDGFVSSSKLAVGAGEITKLSELSDREAQILAEIADGQTSAEISELLNISIRTVETHRKNIHQKLDIKNVAGLVRFAIKSGLVE
ncbi:MAG: response regulator transcription factor [Bacteroidota bacterium]